jgi:hypothetical protein
LSDANGFTLEFKDLIDEKQVMKKGTETHYLCSNNMTKAVKSGGTAHHAFVVRINNGNIEFFEAYNQLYDIREFKLGNKKIPATDILLERLYY